MNLEKRNCSPAISLFLYYERVLLMKYGKYDNMYDKIPVKVGGNMKKSSLKIKLLRIFVVTLTVPIILFSVFMSYNTFKMLKRSTENLMIINMKQMDDNIRLLIDSYEDLLYQVYTDDEMVMWLDKLNSDRDVYVTVGQIRRYLQGLLNTKDYIRAITVISRDGKVITYDRMTSATYESSWLNHFSMTKEEVYEEVSSDNAIHMFPTEYATKFAGEEYYLFHLAHRIIDYKDLNKENGIVILSLDEDLLNSVLQMEQVEMHHTFLVNEKFQIISALEKEMIGKKIDNNKRNISDRVKIYKEFLSENFEYDAFYMSFNYYHDELYGWDIVNVTDQSSFMEEIIGKIGLIIAVGIILLFMDILLVGRLLGELADSVKHIVIKMKEVEGGDLSIRIPLEERMPMEIEMIAEQFNGTLERLGTALEGQKKAEIKALEAQINPHFLYNTLDTINWMAIEKEEYDISNMISALANILRYAISNYSEKVEVRNEVDWLRQYIFLQQYRFKHKFVYRLDVEEDVMHYRIHKLMFQPFVENAIIHGFDKGQSCYLLEIMAQKTDDKLKVIIRDNGKGMPEEIVDKVNAGLPVGGEGKDHIGIDNAISRLHMYCKAREKVQIKSKAGKGTEITLWIPLE